MRRKDPKLLQEPLMKKLVQSILDFLIKSGMTTSQIRSILGECFPEDGSTGPSTRRDSHDSHYVGNGDVSAEVMRIWNRDGRFLDRDAHPRPLQLNRGSNSLGALVRRLDPTGDHMKSIRVMRAVGLIRRLPDGRYVPTAESVKIDHLHPLAVEHIAKSVVRLVTTVCRNTDPSRQVLPLIERYAYAPDMNKKEAAAFAEFTRNQGMAYLEAVDDWLEQRRLRRKAGVGRKSLKAASIAAGVHLFAYMGDYGSPNAWGSSIRGGCAKRSSIAMTSSSPQSKARASTSPRAVRA